jgi:hypothetical protein
VQALSQNKDVLSLLTEAITAFGSTHQLDSYLLALDSKVQILATCIFQLVLQLMMMETFLCLKVEIIAYLCLLLVVNLFDVLDEKGLIQECFRILDTSVLTHRVALL